MVRSALAIETGCCLLVMTLSAAAEDKNDHAVKPFNGKNLEGWKFKHPDKADKWVVGTATIDPKHPGRLVVNTEAGEGGPQMINSVPSTDIYTEQKFGDCTIEVEFMVPKGSNSGIYLMGEYEIQILDSYGTKTPGKGDLGALYGQVAPTVNAARRPGEWQKFVFELQAPRFEGDKKVANGKLIKVTLNGEVIHENVEIRGPTPSGVTGREHPTGPLMFQGDHGPVAFRNIKVTPKS